MVTFIIYQIFCIMFTLGGMFTNKSKLSLKELIGVYLLSCLIVPFMIGSYISENMAGMENIKETLDFKLDGKLKEPIDVSQLNTIEKVKRTFKMKF